MTILVTGVIELDPAKRDEAVAAAFVVMEKTRAEVGCEGYTFSDGGVRGDEGQPHPVGRGGALEVDVDAHMPP